MLTQNVGSSVGSKMLREFLVLDLMRFVGSSVGSKVLREFLVLYLMRFVGSSVLAKCDKVAAQ